MSQFGSANPGNPQVCAKCETLLMDVLDHTASPEDQAFFDRHLAGCTACSRMFVDAKRGEAWLSMLKQPRPEPKPSLFDRILAQTTGSETGGSRTASQRTSLSTEFSAASPQHDTFHPDAVVPFSSGFSPASVVPMATVAVPYVSSRSGSNVLPFRLRAAAHIVGQRMLQPRLAMTAAMAFFSIALTLNLTGVHVTELRLGDLRPSNLRRGFYQANANVVRYYDNLRVVYELEARVHEIQRSSDADAGANPAPGAASDSMNSDGKPAGGKQPKSQPESKPPSDVKPRPKAGPGTSRREPLSPQSEFVAYRKRFETARDATAYEQANHPKGDLA